MAQTKIISYHEQRRFADGLPPFTFNPGHFDKQHMSQFPNSHRNPEFLLCDRGEGYVLHNSERLPFEPGDLVMISPDVIHHVGTDTWIHYQILIIDDRFLDRSGFSIDETPLMPHCHDEKAVALFNRIADAFNEQHPLRTARSIEALLAFLIYIYGQYTSDDVADIHEPPIRGKMRSAIRYICNNYASQFSVEDVADAVMLSVSYYSRAFKKYTGLTTVEYLNKVRCREANTLLSEGLKVQDAAKACGFDNMSYFAKVYREYVGESPSETLAKSK